MRYDVSHIYPDVHFEVTGASYAGEPKDHTIMYITGKAGYLVENLRGHKNCLCFVQNGMEIAEDIRTENTFVFSENPAYEYALFAGKIAKEKRKWEREAGYTLTDGGYYIGKNVTIGKNAEIEPNVLIGHDVVIGDHAWIMSGSVIKHAVIGNDFICNEHAVIGGQSFTMAEDENGNKFRIPSLGQVVIGNHVEVGMGDNIARGSGGNTIMEDYTKLDALVYVGHEAHLHKNAVITSGVMVGGFAEIHENGYIGINASVRNRIDIGSHTTIGMGAVVTKSIEDGITVVGNPARKI